MDKWCFNVQTTSEERLRKALLSRKISLITKLELYWISYWQSGAMNFFVNSSASTTNNNRFASKICNVSTLFSSASLTE